MKKTGTASKKISPSNFVRGDKDKHAGTLIQDAELISQFRMIDELPKDEKSVVSKFIGAYLRDYKARKTYQTA